MWFLLPMLACTQPCEFAARCDGEVLETCHVGVDQLVGSPISRTACEEGPNPVCVETGPDVAFCARDAVCGDDFEPRCDGDAALSCFEGFEVAEDCSLNGPDCQLGPEGAVCALSPLTACDWEQHVNSCEANMVLRCRDGFVMGEDCSGYVPPRTCGEKNDYLFCLEAG